jgi:hypothetical protein
MKRSTIVWGILVATLFVGSSSAFAHHESGPYNGLKATTLKGTVTEFAFANPHVHIFFDAKNEKGETEHWAAECASPRKLASGGFSRDTLKPGDQVKITVYPAMNGKTVGSFIKIILPDGKELPNKNGGGGE